MIDQDPHKVLFLVLAVGMLALLPGCRAQATAPPETAVQALAKKTKEQLVFVKGGEYLMGDFGEIHSEDKLQYSSDLDDGPLHKVVISDFWMSKYKVTLGDYDTYAVANGLPIAYTMNLPHPGLERIRAHPLSRSFPAGVDWKDAKNYCQWIGRQIQQNMDLPTEAEWEYAARARGAMMIFGTDNGKQDTGRNFPSFKQTEAISGRGSGDLPVGTYPPNPLGLYDVGFNGAEWMNDWYAEDYYRHSSTNNPKGPDHGVKKVLRGTPNGTTHMTMTFDRRSRVPELANTEMTVSNKGYGFRCVAR